jgi:hypothetical protein
MFLEWHTKYLPRPYMFIHDKTFHICRLLCVGSIKCCDPYWEMFHAPKIKTHVHATYNSYSYTRNMLKTFFHHHHVNTPCSRAANHRGQVQSSRRARSKSSDRGAITSSAISKCPCYSDNLAFYFTDLSIFSPAANLTDHSIGCAMAGSREI